MGGAGALIYNLPMSSLLLFLLPQVGCTLPCGEEGSWGSRILLSGVSLFPVRYGCSGGLLGLGFEGRPPPPYCPAAHPVSLSTVTKGLLGTPVPPGGCGAGCLWWADGWGVGWVDGSWDSVLFSVFPIKGSFHRPRT